MWLLIDDVRNYNADVIARTADAGIKLLREMEWEAVIMDNDLGEHTQGWQVLDQALREGYRPNRVQICTSNPPARDRMRAMLQKAGYVENKPLDFILMK